MELSLFVLGLSFLFGSTEGAPVGQCNTRDAYTQDDSSCTIYYICTRLGWMARTCAPAHLFNPRILACVQDDLYQCPYTSSSGSSSGSGSSSSSSSSSSSRGCSPTSCQNGGTCTPTLDGLGRCVCRSGFSGNSCENKEAATSSSSSGSSSSGSSSSGSGSGGSGSGGSGSGTSTGTDTGSSSSDTSSGSSAPTSTGKTTKCNGVECVNDGKCVKDDQGTSKCYCRTPFWGPLCSKVASADAFCPVSKESTCDPVCENDGKCFDKNGTPTCYCPEGFNGDRCEISLGPCELLHCQNGGQCNEDNNGVAKCECPAPFSGEFCQLDVSVACYDLQCENNAGCKRVGRTTQCDCPDGYIGDRCQYEDPCPEVKCLNGGTCEAGSKGEALCNCAVGYTGNFCEIALGCDGFTCHNGGKCKLVDNERVCDCPEQTEGDMCEKRLQCRANSDAPCQNGGKCVTSDNGFFCVCPMGRRGIFCEETTECTDKVVCDNDGICDDAAGEGAKCACQDGFKGARCEIKDDDCGGCENGGICELPTILPPDSPPSAKLCACPAGYTGDRCQNTTACALPCPETTGDSNKRYHTFVFPDLEQRDHVFLCRKGRLSHLKYCDDGLWFNPFVMQCHTADTLAESKRTCGNALYTTNIP